MASRKAETLLFRASRPAYTGQIHCRDGTRTTFQTVSHGVFSEVRLCCYAQEQQYAIVGMRRPAVGGTMLAMDKAIDEVAP